MNKRVYKKRYVDVRCNYCGKEYQMQYWNYFRKKNKNDIICVECFNSQRSIWRDNMSDKEKQIISDNISRKFQNKSNEEKKVISVKKSISQQQRWKNIEKVNRMIHMKPAFDGRDTYYKKLTSQEKNDKMKPVIAGFLNWNKNSTIDIKELRKSKISRSMMRYCNNLSDEEKKVRSNNARKQWLISKENKETKLKPMRDGQKNWWKSLTLLEYQDWCVKRAVEFNSYLTHLDEKPNKNELAFISLLKFDNILYKYLYKSTITPSCFNELFPINPINGGFVDPCHAWDFIIYRGDKDILVDIDGSIHDPNINDFEVTNKNGTKFILRDYIQFNDSKRPYQTDGMNAYVILCYDDNITDDTPVLSLHRNEIINVKQLLVLLTPLPSKKELKMAIKDMED